MIRVFLADDHAIVRAGMRHLLRQAGDIDVVGEAADGAVTVRALCDERAAVDVLLLDLSLPRVDGIETLRRVRAARPEIAVLVVSVYPESQYAAQLIELGAAGYLSKDGSEADLVTAVRTVAHGRLYASRSLPTRRKSKTEGAPAHETLSPRELQIFMLLIAGRAVGDIAGELDLGMSTVSTHVGKIRQKLGVQTVGEILLYAHRAGLVS